MDASLPFDPKLIVTTDTLPGYGITASLGVVEGFEPWAHPSMTPEGRQRSFDEPMRGAYLDMMEKAKAQGAQAIVGLRYVYIPEGALLVYGTAVRIQRQS